MPLLLSPRRHNVLSYIESKDILENSLGGAAIPRLVGRLDVRNALLTLAKANWLLEEHGDVDEKIQLFLAEQFLLLHRLARASAIISHEGRTMFFRPQIQILMKYVAQHGQIEELSKPVMAEERHALGMALLAVTDLISSEYKRKRRDRIEKDSLEALTFEMMSTSYSVHVHGLVPALVRSKYLYVNVHQKLAENPPQNFVDINQKFLDATGISLKEYLEIGLGVIAYFLQFWQNSRVHGDLDFILFRPYQWFVNSSVDRDDIAKVLDAISMSLSDFQDTVQKQDRREIAYDFLLMRRKPLLKLGNDAYVPISFSYLCEILTTGVYWIILDYLRSTYGNQAAHEFSSYNGMIFQEYVVDLVREISKRRQSSEQMLVDQLYKVGKEELRSSDVILSGGDYVVLLEASATRLQAKRTTAMGMNQAFEEDCEKMVFHKASQIDTVIRNIKDGKCVLNDVEPRRIQKYYPVIVTIEGFPRFPVIDAYIERGIKNCGILSAGDIAPLSLLDVEDLEFLESKSKMTFVDALVDWHSDPRFPHMGLGEHLSTLAGTENPDRSWFYNLLDRLFRESVERILGRTLPDIVD